MNRSSSALFVALLFAFFSGSLTTIIRDPHVSAQFETWNYHQTSHKVGQRWQKHPESD
ncbi:hypothetical protein PGT21_030204 [Puccinia graminis f. sp. tritici]|uniref:Uncharacterized protein n=1 Tax=Puccinia graminis f. sp. tritici TaxID=56615 RepID=A0A5B0LPU8_PUCGR|nr:hypothetical protein PGT21_030204 [Puccinia graminis f. sp. tritici]KAA1081974.1 hypothetical protein PGTUg99_031200 [Puccinia graminis f. sp. tritici]